MIILFIILIIFYIYYKKNKLLIENGNIIFKNLKKNYNLESLIQDLVQKKEIDINNISKAYLLFGDLKIEKEEAFVFVYNGKINYQALKKSKKTPIFIYKSIKEKNLKLSQILYALYLNDKFYIVKN